MFLSSIFKQLLLKNCAVDFVEICNVCTGKEIIKAAKRIFNSVKICHTYCDFYFGVTFLENSVDNLTVAYVTNSTHVPCSSLIGVVEVYTPKFFYILSLNIFENVHFFVKCLAFSESHQEIEHYVGRSCNCLI